MIHPSRTRTRPFEKLAADNGDLTKLLQAERDATPILLNDWTHALSDTIYAQYFKTGAFPNCVDSLLANGLGRVECLPDYILQAGAGLGLDSGYLGDNGSSQMSTGGSPTSMTGMDKRMDMSESSTSADTAMMEMTPTSTMSTMAAMLSTASMSSTTPISSMSTMTSTPPMSTMSPMSSMQAMTTLNARGCTPPMMFKLGFNVSSLPPEKCANTTSTQLTIPANSTQGWLALNLVNSGSVSKLGVSLDAHSMYIYAADGLYVTLQEVKVSGRPSERSVCPKLTKQGPLLVYWSTLFSHDQAGSNAWGLLSSIRVISNGRYATSRRGSSRGVLQGTRSTESCSDQC